MRHASVSATQFFTRIQQHPFRPEISRRLIIITSPLSSWFSTSFDPSSSVLISTSECLFLQEGVTYISSAGLILNVVEMSETRGIRKHGADYQALVRSTSGG